MTVLLEASELIVRGDMRARAARSALEQVCVRGEDLEFRVAGERVLLTLGAASARRWADAIAAPAPTLAQKLGITATTRLHITGTVDDDALCLAYQEAEVAASSDRADLAIVRTDERTVLEGWCEAVASSKSVPPVWIVYVKGRDGPLGEHSVREVMLRFGFIDVKVAAVSERLTALRFAKKK